MLSSEDFIEVGTDIYKKSISPMPDGMYEHVLKKVSYPYLKRKLPEEFTRVKSYDGFCTIPNHVDYQQEYGKNLKHMYYNKYHKLSHNPKDGDRAITKQFLTHIFGEQLNLGMDYLRLLYRSPREYLPALCLVSEERNTGKTTFLKWLKAIFESNTFFLQNDALLYRFNSHWTDKLLLFMDEAKLYRQVEMDQLKNLITNDKTSTEVKGLDRVESPFFGKFILCSNHVRDFIRIDKFETRFWVVEVPKIENHNPDLLNELVSEIPAFLYYLKNSRMIQPVRLSRHYFRLEDYSTDALKALIEIGKPSLEVNIAIVLIDIMTQLQLMELQATATDVFDLVSKSYKTSQSEVRQVLKNKWQIKPAINTLTYLKIEHTANGYEQVQATGRYYILTEDFFKQNFDELMN